MKYDNDDIWYNMKYYERNFGIITFGLMSNGYMGSKILYCLLMTIIKSVIYKERGTAHLKVYFYF